MLWKDGTTSVHGFAWAVQVCRDALLSTDLAWDVEAAAENERHTLFLEQYIDIEQYAKQV